jgi:hypothetical protein
MTFRGIPRNPRRLEDYINQQDRRLFDVERRVRALSAAGGDGGGGVIRTYEISFATPSTTWVINHNFGSLGVEVNCFDPTGLVQYEPEVELTNTNTATVRWYYPTVGIARVLG